MRQLVLAIDYEIKDMGYKTPCHVWLRATNTGGYPHLYHNGELKLVYKLLWIKKNGPIPNKKILDHLCSVRKCINIEHFEPVSYSTNNRRGFLNGRQNPQELQTHCKRGHEFTPENTLIHKKIGYGNRACKECARQKSKLNTLLRQLARL